jgi:hypothetical protein
MIAVASRWSPLSVPSRRQSPNSGCHAECSDQQRCGETAGAWLPSELPVLDRFSKNAVGRTGFEPVTSSVSGNSRTVPCVCRCRTESNREPLTCEKNLAGSSYVRERLNTLAPLSGSHGVGGTGSRSRRQDHRGLLVARRRLCFGHSWRTGPQRCPSRAGSDRENGRRVAGGSGK